MSNKYWGEYDSSIIFCENKYVESEYIAEYWNTISGLLYVFVGIYFMNTLVKNIGISLVIMGLGTICLHGTLRWYGQWMDEMGMLSLMFVYIKGVYYDVSNNILYLLLGTYMTFNKNHNVFLLIFVSLLYYQYNAANNIIRTELSKNYKKYYFISMSLGGICWLLYRVCFTKVLNFHMYWHVLSSFGCIFGTLVYYEHSKSLHNGGKKIKDWYLKIKCK